MKQIIYRSRTFNKYFLCVLIMISLFGCKVDEIIEDEDRSDNQTVKVVVDLQYGFNGHSVLLKFNGIEYYRAVLDNSVPIAGPISTFTTTLPRGENTCYAFWMQLYTPELVWFVDSLEVYLGDSDQYYLGYTIYGDTLNITVQDSSFGYW